MCVVRAEVLVEKARLLRDQGAQARAGAAFAEVIRIARERDLWAAETNGWEAEYAATQARLGHTEQAREEAERLSLLREPPHLQPCRAVARAGRDREGAGAGAARVPERRGATGPPYAKHWDLQECRAVLAAVGEAGAGAALGPPGGVAAVCVRGGGVGAGSRRRRRKSASGAPRRNPGETQAARGGGGGARDCDRRGGPFGVSCARDRRNSDPGEDSMREG